MCVGGRKDPFVCERVSKVRDANEAETGRTDTENTRHMCVVSSVCGGGESDTQPP